MPRLRRGKHLSSMVEQIGKESKESTDQKAETYADVDSIDTFEASSCHTQSRPPSSHGFAANPSLSPTGATESRPLSRERDPEKIQPVPRQLRDFPSNRPNLSFWPPSTPRKLYHESLPPDHPKEWHHCHLCRLKSEWACNDPSHRATRGYFPKAKTTNDAGDDESKGRRWMGGVL